MKNLNENKFDAEVNIFDIYRLCESVIRFTNDLKKSYNVLSKDINKFVNEAGVESLHEDISNFNRLMYVTTDKSVDPAIHRLGFYKVKELQSATSRLALLIKYFNKEVDKFIDFLYENEAFDIFDEDKADELSSLSCSLSLSFVAFRSWVQKI